MILYVRCALYTLWFVAVTIVMNLISVPFLFLPRPTGMPMGQAWAQLVLFGLRTICGLRVEIRGHKAEPHHVLLAVKHLTMWETVAFQGLFADPAIVIKRELLAVPFYGWYCRKMKMIAIDRDAGASSIRAMVRQGKAAITDGRPVVIFPEGTRRKEDDRPDYKPGIAALYMQLGVPCVPMAHNSSLFWQGRFIRRPGTVVLEYLEPIPHGLPRREFMALLQARIEEGAKRLLAEGRIQGDARRNS
jgi:1-acyl-sn-glycerol-3-phosphate acyltransferase